MIFKLLAKNRHFEQKTGFFAGEFADIGDKTFMTECEKEKVFTHSEFLSPKYGVIFEFLHFSQTTLYNIANASGTFAENSKHKKTRLSGMILKDTEEKY